MVTQIQVKAALILALKSLNFKYVKVITPILISENLSI